MQTTQTLKYDDLSAEAAVSKKLIHFLKDDMQTRIQKIDWEYKAAIKGGYAESFVSRYREMLQERDTYTMSQNKLLCVGLRINRHCELWSDVCPDMPIKFFKLFVENLNKYHRSDLSGGDSFILSVLNNNYIKLGWDESLEIMSEYITKHGKWCVRILAIVMCFTGNHTFWLVVYNKTSNKAFKNAYIAMFGVPDKSLVVA